jgi:hypothetical protein
MPTYKTIESFLKAAKTGVPPHRVIVDNDCVDAYTLVKDDSDQDPEHLCDFEGEGPGGALIAVLALYGIDADYA